MGAGSTSLSDAEAEAVFDEAAETYTVTASAYAYARILAIRGMLASSAKFTSYKQNASSENASDVFKHLAELLKFWQGELNGAIRAAGNGAVRSGKTKWKPTRIKEYPGW